jgi:hypothetical protein
MNHASSQSLPSTGRLLKATFGAALVAALVLVAFVLPAEFGIDPTGIGSRLGLDVLARAQAAEPGPAPVAPAKAEAAADPLAQAVAIEARKAEEAFGPVPGQSFDVQAVARESTAQKSESMTVTIPGRDGVEIKAPMKAGDAMVFHWTATGDLSVDMHGQRLDAEKDVYTSYWIEPVQREGAGTLTAPFDGIHGWFWLNRGTGPVTVTVEVVGFQDKLFIPSHK